MEFETVIITITLVAGAYMAWNIGANDVANAMGTSVGSKAIRLRTATLIAAIFTFSGAYLVGPAVSSTIKGKIVDPSIYSNIDIFVIGMLAALLASAIWLNIATYLGWPVSTTHSLIGAIIGFGLASKGVGAIQWMKTLEIAASWIISPVSGGIIASLVFFIIIRLIFFAPKPIQAAKQWIPWIVAGTSLIIVLSLLYKGLKHFRILKSSDYPDGIPLIQSAGHPEGFLPAHAPFVIAIVVGVIAFLLAKLWMRSIRQIDEDATRTQKFKVVESIFAKLQVASACYVAFAHGANDVANSIGPVAAVWDALQNGQIDVSAQIPSWLLLAGGIFIGLGICIWGYRVIQTIGERITGITPSRGFAAEFGTATTVLICSQMGLPISTTHTLVGSVIGVGFARGMRALNMGVVRRIVESWILTIPFTAVLTIIIFFILKIIIL